MENLLYYPYINIPQTDWTKRVLLYYDKVASIAPQRYFYQPEDYDPFMKDMVRMELVEPVNPLEVLENPWRISAPFIDYIKSEDFKLKKD